MKGVQGPASQPCCLGDLSARSTSQALGHKGKTLPSQGPHWMQSSLTKVPWEGLKGCFMCTRNKMGSGGRTRQGAGSG